MKIILALAIAGIAASPAMAAWTSGVTGGVREYRVGAPGNRGTSMVLSCPTDSAAFITVQVDGVLPPSGEQVGFKAAGRTVAIRSADSGSIKINTEKDRANFRNFWAMVRAGSVMTISYTNGVTASLSLKGSAKALPVRPCNRY
jgi:hypothetical protein